MRALRSPEQQRGTKQWAWKESNLRPRSYQERALATEPHAHTQDSVNKNKPFVKACFCCSIDFLKLFRS